MFSHIGVSSDIFAVHEIANVKCIAGSYQLYLLNFQGGGHVVVHRKLELEPLSISISLSQLYRFRLKFIYKSQSIFYNLSEYIVL